MGERYYAYLRRVFNKGCADSPTISTKLSLTLVVKAVTRQGGPSGLVTTLLVFGIMPLLPVRPSALKVQVERMKAAVAARKEMNRILANQRLEITFSHNVPYAADSCVKVHDEVLMYREKSIGKWLGT